MELLRHPSPKKISRSVNVYLSTFERSSTDEKEILERINELFRDARSGVSPHPLRLDCKSLFVEYGTALA
jgi:hypothetical protein